MKESSLVRAVTSYWGQQSYQVALELPFLLRHVDVVGFEPDSDTLVAVEAKVQNWQSAIKQAATCLLFADQVFVAMPVKYIHRVQRSELDRFGIGLLEVGAKVRVVLAPVRSKYRTDRHRIAVLQRIEMLRRPEVRGKSNGNH